MTKRLPVTPAPAPLEEYAERFDDLFGARAQRQAFRRYLEGLLLPAERNKTLTALANVEPVLGAQHAHAQSLQWFLSESRWEPEAINDRRIGLLRSDPLSAPSSSGALVIDEHGDRKWGKHTAHVGRQWLGNLGKVDSGVVSVSSLWADEGIYYPLEVEPYTPEHHFEKGKADPAFRTKLKIATELVKRSVEKGIPFRAVVADPFYGEDEGFKEDLEELGVGYVLALKPTHSWWHKEGEIGALWQAAEGASKDAREPGAWTKVERTFRDGHTEGWWALEVKAGPYGPEKARRAVVATTDPEALPELSTWYLVTDLPAPNSERAAEEGVPAAADVFEVVRLYGLRMWVEQSYKQVKHALGWSDYQVRSDLAIRRHWQLACLAFSFCWHAGGRAPEEEEEVAPKPNGSGGLLPQETDDGEPAATGAAGRGKNEPPRKSEREKRRRPAPGSVVASGVESGEGLAGAMPHALAILEGVHRFAPAERALRVLLDGVFSGRGLYLYVR